MADKERYKKLREKGICTICKHRPSEDGMVTCRECRAKQKTYQKERRTYLKSIGFCPQCGSEKLYGDEKLCLECSAKKYAWNLKCGRTEKAEENRKTRYERRKASGICVKCGTRPAEHGKTRCRICNFIEARRAKSYRGDIDRNARPSYGLCYICGEKAMDGKRLCKKCAETSIKNLQNRGSNENHPWKIESIRVAHAKKVSAR